MTLKEWYIRIKNKLIYSIGVHFPYSKVRVRSLRALGWEVGKNVYFPADIVITQNFVYYRGELEMGDNVSIGPRCTLVLSSHPNASTLKKIVVPKSSKIVMKDNAWLGAGCIVLPGVKVGANSVIGAGAVVTKDVPEWSIVAGVPAKVIKTIPHDVPKYENV